MLDNIQIDAYMKHLSKIYPEFLWVGCLPSDIHPKYKVYSDYNYGMIFNLDKAKQDGSHWVACYVDNHPTEDHSKSVEYYDPTGMPPIKSIDKYLRKQFGNKGYKYKVNRIEHQDLYL